MSKSKLYIIKKPVLKIANATAKPIRDVEIVLEKNGAINLGLPTASFSIKRLFGAYGVLSTYLAMSRLPRNGILFLQYPSQTRIRPLINRAVKKNLKIIILIHDIDSLRSTYSAPEMEILAHADVIIAHTPRMAAWLEEQLGKKIVVLGPFDYLLPAKPTSTAAYSGPAKIVFAGNLRKSPFLEQLSFNGSNIELSLFGNGLSDTMRANPAIVHRGVCRPDELPYRLTDYHFGLVWDGTSVDGCQGGFGQYLRYNSPHKLSLYIASGLPLIIWSQMGLADFVTRHGIGLTVESLDEMEDKIANLSADEYTQMKNNVLKLQESLTSGGMIQAAFDASLKSIE